MAGKKKRLLTIKATAKGKRPKADRPRSGGKRSKVARLRHRDLKRPPRERPADPHEFDDVQACMNKLWRQKLPAVKGGRRGN